MIQNNCVNDVSLSFIMLNDDSLNFIILLNMIVDVVLNSGKKAQFPLILLGSVEK